jgi:hypothetical protein
MVAIRLCGMLVLIGALCFCAGFLVGMDAKADSLVVKVLK